MLRSRRRANEEGGFDLELVLVPIMPVLFTLLPLFLITPPLVFHLFFVVPPFLLHLFLALMVGPEMTTAIVVLLIAIHAIFPVTI